MPSTRSIDRVVLSLSLCGLLAISAHAVRAQQGDQESQGNSSTAQRPRGGPPTAAGELAQLSRALTLTDEQKAAILPLLETKHTRIEALMHSSTDRAAVGQEMHTIVKASNAEVRALLTEEQQKIFDAMRPQHPPAPGEGSGQGEGAPPQDGTAPPQQ